MRFANITILIALSAVMLGASADLHAAADLCTGAIDPYDMVAEKTRFYTAAGKDNELSATEFAAIKVGPTSFRHKFDKWSEMLKFDSDSNKSIDWLEAGAYRLAMRKKVLDAYDANLDGKLTESEREAACKALASGRIRFDVKKKSSKPDPRLAEHERSMKAKQHKQSHSGGDKRRPHERPDPHAHKRHSEERKRHEGGGNDDEAQKRKDKTMMQYGYWIEKHDKNGDGELNDQEKAAAKADYHKSFTAATPAVRAANQAKLNEWRRRYAAKMAARKAGKSPTPKSKPPTPQAPEPKPVLSEEEQAKQDERNKRKAEFLEKYDTNRDGKISSEEKSAFVRDIKAKKAEREKEKAKLRKDSGKRKPPKPPKSHKKRPRKGR